MTGSPDHSGVAVPRYRQPHERSFGLRQLDLKLATYVKDTGGFFVEAGANDGISQSNTLFLARYRGWRGLLVEPVPELAARCRVLRPESRVEQAALVGPDHTAPTARMRFAHLMSVVEGARGSDEEDRRHAELGAELQGLTETYELEVPARSLSSILDAHGIRHVDLLSLDLEGYEPGALRGLDLERHRPTWVLVEAWERSTIDEIMDRWYVPVAELSHHDVLYRVRRARRLAARGVSRS